MLTDEFKYRITSALGLTPTVEQQHAIGVFANFLACRDSNVVMVLRGSAGTGKTTLAAAIVRAMASLQIKMVLLSPTGRAAKVFSLYSGHSAFTIHRHIYMQKSAVDSLSSGFQLNYTIANDTLFIVDEASMIGDSSTDSSLLSDLIQYVYRGRNCRMLLIGDAAQLPPVGETESPALQSEVLRSFGLTVFKADLNEVLRQSADSGILYNATQIRNGRVVLPKINLQFDDVSVVPGDELIEQLSTSYNHVGLDDTIIVTRSNKRANIYNEGIRRMVLDREDELCRGDRLMIVKNNYSLLTTLPSTLTNMSFIANGDIAVVQRVRNVHEQHGFRFAEVTLLFPDYDDYELTATVMLDTLMSESPALTREQQAKLFESVMADYADIPRKADRIKKLKEDRYYNALQVKFAYAVTCHKAQGGQWAHVYIDQGYMTDDMLSLDYIHWLYTAFTRSTEKLFLVNWPTSQIN